MAPTRRTPPTNGAKGLETPRENVVLVNEKKTNGGTLRAGGCRFGRFVRIGGMRGGGHERSDAMAVSAAGPKHGAVAKMDLAAAVDERPDGGNARDVDDNGPVNAQE